MDDSSYLIKIKEEFDSLFPAGWIDDCSWDKATEKKSFSEGSSKIDSFRVNFFILLSKLILSGEYFYTETDKLLKDLDAITYHETHVVSKQILKKGLEDLYDNLLLDMRDCISLASHFITSTQKRFEQKNLDEFFIAVKYNNLRENRHYLVNHFEDVLDACKYDFDLSYREDIIKKILLTRDLFLHQPYTNKEIGEIDGVIISKLEFLLYKLSYVSDCNTVEYTMNAQHIIIEPLKNEKEKKILKLRDLFLDYEQVENWKQIKTNEFIVNPYADSIQMWKAVMLMRYYTKKRRISIRLIIY